MTIHMGKDSLELESKGCMNGQMTGPNHNTNLSSINGSTSSTLNSHSIVCGITSGYKCKRGAVTLLKQVGCGIS